MSQCFDAVGWTIGPAPGPRNVQLQQFPVLLITPKKNADLRIKHFFQQQQVTHLIMYFVKILKLDNNS